MQVDEELLSIVNVYFKNDDAFTIRLINITKKRGPRMKPCGTPWVRLTLT